MDDEERTERYERDESTAHRLDRNFAELLQELRVAQTGVQILFAFLLTIAFQPRFDELATGERGLYIVTLMSAAVAAVLLIGPVAAHRVLFARHRKDDLVAITGRLAAVGLVFLVIAMAAAVLLVVGFIADLGLAIGLTVALVGVVVVTWLIVPFRALHAREETSDRQ